MASANPSNPLYKDLWKELFEDLIKPVLKEDLSRSEPLRGLPPRLTEHSYDEHLYPIIYDLIIRALEVYCEETILPKLLNMRGPDLIMEVWVLCLKDLHLKNMKIWYPLLALERTHNAVPTTRSNKREYPSLERRAGGVFRRAVYGNMADILREAAFGCITDTFTISCDCTLDNYLEVLHYIRTNDSKFFDEEWNIFAHSKFVGMIYGSLRCGERPFQEFLKCSENMFVSFETIFQLSTPGYEESLEQALFEIRDERIFSNGAQVFKTMLDESSGKTLKRTFNTFERDEEFPKTVALQSEKLFSELVKGEGQNRYEDFLNQENTSMPLFSIWKRIHKIHKNGDQNEQTIHEALIVPFLHVVRSTYPEPKEMMSVFAQYSDHLISWIHQSQTRLEPEGISEIRAMLALVSHLPISDAFHVLFRALLSSRLLKGTSELFRTNQLLTVRSSQNQIDAVSDIFAMLDDASTWPSYELEMLPAITMFGLQYGKIDFEPMVVRRSRWDLEPDIGLILPRKLRLLSRTALKHLHLWHPMRCVSIHSSMGEINITANVWTFQENYVRIKLSTAQGCVLMLFEEDDEIAVRDVAKSVLSTSSKLASFNDVVAIIKSMMTEHEILLKKPQNSKFRETDVLCLNKQFQPTSEFITLPSPEYCDVNRKGLQAVLKNALTKHHKMVLEACVMKVLKQVRVMDLCQLKERVYAKLVDNGNVVMTSFEELIGRLARDEYLTVEDNIARYVE